jgi:hypothetical protein
MTTYKLAVIPGPGIGGEVIPEAIRLLENTDLSFDYTYFEIGYEVFKRTGTPVPDACLGLRLLLSVWRATKARLLRCGVHWDCMPMLDPQRHILSQKA